MAGLLFHKVSDKEKKEIRTEAKRLMDSFSRKLSTMRDKRAKGSSSSDKELPFEREENEDKDENFCKEIMFENAPGKNKDFIIAERKGWE